MNLVFLLVLNLIINTIHLPSAETAPLVSATPNVTYNVNGLGKWGGRTIAICVVMGALGLPCPDTDALPGDDQPLDITAGAFLLNFSVGDAHQKVSLIADTTVDMTFMLCLPCRDCSVQTNIEVYNRTQSATFSKYTCKGSMDCPASRYAACSNELCTYNYVDYPTITSNGFLARDTFSLSKNEAPVDVVFGCGTANTGYYGNSVGFVGLGRGPLSFVSQLNLSLFSYCLTLDSSYSQLFLGSEVRLRTISSGSTKFLENRRDPILYYVNMTGITIGGKRVSIPSTAYLPQPDGTGGMVIDSVSSITLLEESVYFAIKNEFIKQIKLSQVDALTYHLDLCFSISSSGQGVAPIPELILHFDGADMNPNNYFMKTVDEKAICLMILPAKGTSILGNLMQMDRQMIFDIGNMELRFESVLCRGLSKI